MGKYCVTEITLDVGGETNMVERERERGSETTRGSPRILLSHNSKLPTENYSVIFGLVFDFAGSEFGWPH